MEPGWSWEKCVKPIVKTDSCQAPHTQYIVSGRIKVVMDDGTSALPGTGLQGSEQDVPILGLLGSGGTMVENRRPVTVTGFQLGTDWTGSNSRPILHLEATPTAACGIYQTRTIFVIPPRICA